MKRMVWSLIMWSAVPLGATAQELPPFERAAIATKCSRQHSSDFVKARDCVNAQSETYERLNKWAPQGPMDRDAIFEECSDFIPNWITFEECVHENDLWLDIFSSMPELTGEAFDTIYRLCRKEVDVRHCAEEQAAAWREIHQRND